MGSGGSGRWGRAGRQEGGMGGKVGTRRKSGTDLGFRVSTGLFAAALLVIVVVIGFELSLSSLLSCQ